jgi:hypothetical protein
VRVWVIAVVLAGCGRLAFDPLDDAGVVAMPDVR